MVVLDATTRIKQNSMVMQMKRDHYSLAELFQSMDVGTHVIFAQFLLSTFLSPLVYAPSPSLITYYMQNLYLLQWKLSRYLLSCFQMETMM